MPAAIGVVIAKIGGFIIGGLTAVGVPFGAAVAILDFGIKLAGLSFLSYVSNKLYGVPEFAESIQGTQVVSRGTLEHQRIVFGEVLVGGTLQYINTAGTNNELLHESIVLAGHECEDITDVWLDDTKIPSSGIAWTGSGHVTSGQYSGSFALRLEKHLGKSSQSASPSLNTNFSEINSSHIGAGITYGVAIMRYVEETKTQWEKGEPQAIKWLLKGHKLYNPSSDSTTSFGTGPHRADISSTWQYSRNPALAWGTYMVDDELGFGEDPEWVDWGYVATASAVCSGFVHTPVGTSQRYACDLVLHTGRTHQENLESILSTFNGSQAEVNGVFKLRAFAYDTPTLELTENHLRDDIQISLDEDPDARFNTVRGYFVDKDRQWQGMAFPAVTASEYVSRDNDEVLHRDIQLAGTTDVYMAQRLAFGILEQSDLQERVIFPSNFRTLPCEVNGTVMVTNTDMEWSQKPFRVERFAFRDMEGIDLVLKGEDPAAYSDVGTAEYTVVSGGILTLPSVVVPPPSSIWVVSHPIGILVSWTPPPARLYEYVDVYSSVNSWGNASRVATSKGQTAVVQLATGQTRNFWVRARNYVDEESTRLPNSNVSTVTETADVVPIETPVTATPANGSSNYTSGTQPRVESNALDEQATYTAPSNLDTHCLATWTAQARISVLTSGTAVGESRLRILITVDGVTKYDKYMVLEGFLDTNDLWATLAGTLSFPVPAGEQIIVRVQSFRSFSTSGSSPAQTHRWQNVALSITPQREALG